MQVRNFMSKDVRYINQDRPVFEAADMMRDHNIGALIVEGNEKITGMITDRDLALRAIWPGVKLEDVQVKDCMSEGIKYCFVDESMEDVGRQMAKSRFRRLPVLSRSKELVGIVSIVDLADTEEGYSVTHETLRQTHH